MKQLLLFTVLLFAACTAGQRGVPPTEGIPNFGEVTSKLYRGAQPDECALSSLQRRGVKTIINLRLPHDVWPVEEAAARAKGMAYHNLALHALRAPTSEQIAEILALIDRSLPPVFVHCEHGADRTGTVVASYRIQNEGWTAEEALAEANRFGMSQFQLGMRAYIRRSTETRDASATGKRATGSSLVPAKSAPNPR